MNDVQIRPWYWLESGDDDALGWHDCGIGEWSLVVGGEVSKTGLRPVTRRYRGPWFAEFQPTIDRNDSTICGPFKTAKEAKRAAVQTAVNAIADILKAVGKLT